MDFKNMTCKELTNTCRENNWKGYSKCKVKKEMVEFCYKQSGNVSPSLMNIDKDRVIKELQEKVKEYELKESFENEDPVSFPDVISEEEAEESDSDNCTEEVDSDNNIICGKCGVRGHHSYKCGETIFKFNSEYESTAASTLNIYKHKLEVMEKDKKEMADKLVDLERLKLLEKKQIKEHKEKADQDLQTYKKFKEILNKDIKYNIINSNCKVNTYHKKRYDLFINEHSSPEKQIILYHGTDDKNIEPIMENGLSLTTHKIHGSVHGEGIYFSSDIDYAMLYPRNGNHIKTILVCQVYVNHTILGKLAMTTFPLSNYVYRKKSIYFDTGVDSLSNPKIYVKKSVEEINILGYIQIDNRKINREPKNVFQGQRAHTAKKGCIKIENRTSNIIDIYWNPIRGQSLINLDIRKCKKMNSSCPQGGEYPISSWIGDSFIAGYYDKSRYFNIVKIITVSKDRETFIIN